MRTANNTPEGIRQPADVLPKPSAWALGCKMKADMMKMQIAVLAALLLAGCATPYQRTGFSGGFSETRLQENAFSVSFRGNGYTSRERSTDFALLRCAELTLENGFKFFVITDSAQDTKTAYYNTGGSSQTYGTVNTIGNTSYGSFNTYHSGSTTVPIHKPRSAYTIFCFKEKPEGAMAFDAAYLADSIRQKHGINKTPQQTVGGDSETRAEDGTASGSPQP